MLRRYLRRLVLFLLGLLLVMGWVGIGQRSIASTPAMQLIEQGRTFYANQQFEQAVDVWQQAEQRAEQSGDRLQQATALTYVSLAAQQLGEWAQAQAAIDESFSLLDGAPPRSPVLAQALNVQGRLALALGNSEAALAAWQQATEVYQDLGDRVGVTGSLINQAQALEAAGLSRRACATLLKALEISSDCDRRDLADLGPTLNRLAAQPDPQVQALGFRNLGNVLRLVGYYPESQRVLESARLSEQQPSDASATLRSLADTERVLYEQAKSIYEQTGSNRDRDQVKTLAKQAFVNYQQASEIAAQVTAPNTLQIQAQLQQLDLLIDFQQWLRAIGVESDPKAEVLQPQIQTQINALANACFDRLPISRTSIAAQIQIAQALLQAQQAEQLTPSAQPQTTEDRTAFETQILQRLTLALQQANALGDARAISYALGSLGRFYEQIGESQPDGWLQARQQTEQALSLAQSQQAWDIAYQWQWQLGRLYATRGETAQAIAYYQAAIETLESVRSSLLALDAEVQLSFRQDVEPVYRELAGLLLADPTQTNLKLAVQAIEGLQVSELENFLRCNLIRIAAIDEVADAETAIVYTILLPDRLTVILNPFQSDRLLVSTRSISSGEVEATLMNFRTELEKDSLPPDGAPLLPLAQQVYDWLIRPFDAILQENQVKTLVFVLDGAFRSVPMAALHSGQRYLLEDYAIALTPGLQLLPAQPLEPDRLDTLGFGLSELRQGFPPHDSFAPLVNVPLELEDIRKQVPSEIRLNQQFTRTTLQAAVVSSNSPIVHLATHGNFSSVLRDTFILTWEERLDLDNLSGILLSRDQATAQPIELLVLSACKTAAGDRRAGLGLAGVAVRSGARSTVASLWAVNDQATAELMERFYQALADPSSRLSRAEALRQAQLELMSISNSTADYKPPFYWAAFVLVGSWL